jgi:hypothetical protein
MRDVQACASRVRVSGHGTNVVVTIAASRANVEHAADAIAALVAARPWTAR